MHTARRSSAALGALLVATVATFTASPTWAQKSLEEILVEKGVLTQQDLEELKKEQEAQESETDATEEKAEEPATEEKAEEPDPNDIEITASSKGLIIKTRDDKFKFAFGGRMQLDAAVFIEDETNLGDGTEMRRARIKSYGTLWHDWDYKLEVNFETDSTVEITDGWLRYSRFKPFTLTLGHQKVPFSQQSMTSSNWQVFQERGLNNAFIDTGEVGRRRMGAVVQGYGDHWNYAGGIFSGDLGTSGDGNDEDLRTGHRLVVQPIREETKLFAVGASVIYQDFEGGTDLRFRQRPEAHVADKRLVDTAVLANVDDMVLYDFEATGFWGPWHAQAEYTAARVWRNGVSNLDLYGFYVQAGVFLTGESRVYDHKSAKFKRPIPAGKWGAWELAVRFSQLDLTNGDIAGGVQRDFTAGINWWANRNIMFRFNYVYGDASPNSTVTLGGENEEVHAFTGRAQVVF